MRTTVSIDAELLAAARKEARQRGQTLGQLVEDSLRRELSDRRSDDSVPLPVFRSGTGVRAGVDLRSNRALAELLDG
jgi:hypothetical protein